MPVIVRIAMVVGALALALVPSGGQASPPPEKKNTADSRACAEAISRIELGRQIPSALLHAISLAETGRWDTARKASFAWPWTVTSGGAGSFYATKEEAIAAVQRLRAKGVRNIDVGCMQVNLMHHPDAFTNLSDAFAPATNAAYAAQFLLDLRDAHNSWSIAVAHYHSANPDRGVAYRQKVFSLWSEARRRLFAEAREERLAAWRAQQEARRAAHPRSGAVGGRYVSPALLSSSAPGSR